MMINRKELIRIEYIIYDSKSLKTPPRIIKINKARKMEMKEIILNVKEIKLSSFFENHIIEDLIFKDLKYTKATTIKMIKVKWNDHRNIKQAARYIRKTKNKQIEFILVTKGKEEIIFKKEIVGIFMTLRNNFKDPKTNKNQLTIKKTEKIIIQEYYNSAEYYDTTTQTTKYAILRDNKVFSVKNNIKNIEIQKITNMSKYTDAKIWTQQYQTNNAPYQQNKKINNQNLSL